MMMYTNYYSSIIATILFCVLLLSASTTTTVNGDNTCSQSNGGDEADDTIYKKVCADSDLSTLCEALKFTGLEDDLSRSYGGEFTLFAPLNSAFEGAPLGLIGFDKNQKKKTLKYHVTSDNKDTTSGDDTTAADANLKLSCTSPTSTQLTSVKLGDFTSQTQCEDDGTTRIGQLGKAIVKGIPLFVADGSDDTPCNGRIIKVTNILGSGLTFFPPQKNGKDGKNGKNGKSSKNGKNGKGSVRGSGAWRHYGNNPVQEELLFSSFGVRVSNNNNYNNNYNTKKGPKSFKAGKDFKAGKSFKNYGSFYGKAAKRGKRE